MSDNTYSINFVVVYDDGIRETVHVNYSTDLDGMTPRDYLDAVADNQNVLTDELFNNRELFITVEQSGREVARQYV